MHYRIAAISALTLVSALAHGNDDGVQGAIMVDEMEHRWTEDSDDPIAWSVAATVGMDQHSLWMVSEGDHALGDLGGHELLGYYSYATDSGWNLNAGWRGDLKPEPDKDWALLGVDGELPGAIAVAGSSYYASGGDSAFRLEVERGFEPGANWYLVPEMRADFYGQDMPESGRGSGLSTLELAARLGYEWTDGIAT